MQLSIYEEQERANGQNILPSYLDVLGPLYTHIDALDHYGWKSVGHQPITPEKKLLTKRNVGGDIFVGDERVAVAQDVESVPAMLVMGMPVVYKEIRQGIRKIAL